MSSLAALSGGALFLRPFGGFPAGPRERTEADGVGILNSALFPTYARADVSFERGEGAWLFAASGDRYLDFGGGVAVMSLGYAHPHLVEILRANAERPWHVSNLYQNPEAERLARRLTEATFADLVFFANSGAEAVECAIKTARKYHAANGAPERYRLITFEGAFHGRTLATLAAGGNPKYLEGFGPKVDGFDAAPFGDLAAVEALIGPETAGILIEPIQGEGGIRVFPRGFLKGLRELCDKRGLLLVVDEVQTGVGRTGTFLAIEQAGVAPDIAALAKGLGGGFPIGACLATREAAKGMIVGAHGSTFGGNPLAAAVANGVLDVVLAPGFMERVARLGSLFRQRLAELTDRFPSVIEGVRGEGLMFGVKTRVANTDLVAAARKAGLLVISAGDNVVRLLPPLIIDEEHIAEAVRRLESACAELEREVEQRPGAGL
jgi:acetylornithine/N-succinyldiaminopimelate aminotransferase